jgi:hypothetical protein
MTALNGRKIDKRNWQTYGDDNEVSRPLSLWATSLLSRVWQKPFTLGLFTLSWSKLCGPITQEYCTPHLCGSINPLPLLFKSLPHGQNYRVFFSGYLQLPTTPETGLTFVDVYALITFIHVHTCLLSDFIAPGNRTPVWFVQRNRFRKRTTRALWSV